MFKISYTIVDNETDALGTHGFMQIICKDFKYGRLYNENMHNFIQKYNLGNFYEKMLELVNDFESGDIYVYKELVIKRKKNEVFISLDSHVQKIEFTEFESEIFESINNYVNDVKILNKNVNLTYLEKAVKSFENSK